MEDCRTSELPQKKDIHHDSIDSKLVFNSGCKGKSEPDFRGREGRRDANMRCLKDPRPEVLSKGA